MTVYTLHVRDRHRRPRSEPAPSPHRRRAPTRPPSPPRLSHEPQIFNRKGTCLYYKELSRPVAVTNAADERKLLFGFLFSLKDFVKKLSPKK